MNVSIERFRLENATCDGPSRRSSSIATANEIIKVSTTNSSTLYFQTGTPAAFVVASDLVGCSITTIARCDGRLGIGPGMGHYGIATALRARQGPAAAFGGALRAALRRARAAD